MRPDFFYDSHKLGTMKLEHYLSKFNSFDEFEQKFSDEFLNDDCRVGDFLSDLLYKYDMKASVVSNAAGQDPSYLGKIINGKGAAAKNPKRDALIAFCLVMRTSLEELQQLLKYSGHQPLYVRRKRDVVIWYGIMKQESIQTIDVNLIKRNLKPLLKDAKKCDCES